MKKRFRVQFDFTIETDEEDIQLNPNVTWEPQDEAWEKEYLERQHRLFHALLAQPEALGLYITYLISSEIESLDWRRWRSTFLGGEFEIEDILEPVISTLDADDQAFFADKKERQIFYENTEEFQAGFSTSWDEVTLTELTE